MVDFKKGFSFSNAEYKNGMYDVNFVNPEGEKLSLKFVFEKYIIDKENEDETFNAIYQLLNDAFNARKYKISQEDKEELTKKIVGLLKFAVESSTRENNVFHRLYVEYEGEKKDYAISLALKNKLENTFSPVFILDSISIEVKDIKRNMVQTIESEELEEQPPYIEAAYIPSIGKFLGKDGESDSFNIKEEIQENKSFNELFYDELLDDIVLNARINLA